MFKTIEVSSRFSFILLPDEDSSSQEEKVCKLEEFYPERECDVKEDDLLEEICHFERKNRPFSVLAIL